MGKDAVRLGLCALASIALIATGAFALDWFRATVSIEGIAVARGGLDLSSLPGTPAQLTSWTTLAFGLCIVFQVGRLLTGGPASGRLVAAGALLGLASAAVAFATAYVVPPPGTTSDVVTLALAPTWGPPCEIAGELAGIVTLFLLRGERAAEPAPVVAKPRTAPPATSALRGKLRYATALAEVTAAGIEARGEDGSDRLVLWRDVVGVVARRLPAEVPYDGTPFVDIVSTAGSTLRLLPWTRLTGATVEGDGDGRARALVQLVVARCPAVQLDPATRRFLAGPEPAAQLRDAATLAAHDEQLA